MVLQTNLEVLSSFGIFKESYKIILTCPKIFMHITLAFILPQACLNVANNWISMLTISKMNHNIFASSINQVDSPSYNNISNSISSEQIIYWLINMVYCICTIILSLFTISAVVYTVACVYTGKDVTLRKVMRVVPKVWKQVMITFLCQLCIIFAYSFVLSLVLIILIFMLFYKKGQDEQVGIVIPIIGLIIVILLTIGLFYVTMIWQLANIVSVLEKICGFNALIKSKELIKGKLGTAFALLLEMNFCALPIFVLKQKFAGFGIVERICFGILSLVLWTLIILFGLVVQTVFYLVCKSYHHESIDKSSLADHLDVYLGEYVPLKDESIQLERLNV